jgi:hypothetical protein
VWAASLRLYCKSFPHVWPQAAGISIIAVLMIFLTNSESYHQVSLDNITTANMIYFFMSLVASLAILYFGALLLYRIYVIGEGRNVTLGASVVYVGKKYFKIIIGMSIVLVISVLGAFAFIVPGIFLFLLFFMVQPLILFDEQGCFAALKGSYKLVWGNWWRTFSIFFPITILNCLAVAATQYAYVNTYWYMIVGVGFARIFIYPLLHSCIIMQFGDLKLRYQEKRQTESL